jgi:hypothetical protein
MNISENKTKKAWKKPYLTILTIQKTTAGDGDTFDGEGFNS